MEGLEFVFKLKWKNSSHSGISLVGLNDTPTVTGNLELFKSNLFRNSGDVGLYELRVAMQLSQTNEWVIDSQPEFERALLAFRYKATKNEVIVVNVYEEGCGSVQNETANDAESVQVSENKEPPEWFLTFMRQFRQELIEEVSNAVKKNAGWDERCANTAAPTLFPSDTTERNEEVEETNVGETELHIPQKEEKPLRSILDLPSKVLFIIFLNLNHASISKCARTCKKFYELSKDAKLFPYIKITSGSSKKYAQWLLDRATNPRKVLVTTKMYPDLVANKLGTWHNLDELELTYLNLSHVHERSLKNLRSLSLEFCTINCKTLGKLLKHSKAISNVSFKWINCSNCGKTCDTGILSALNLKTCVENLAGITISNYTCIVQADLHRLSACAGLKALKLSVTARTPNRKKAVLAMEMVARTCTKLEHATFQNLDLVTDNVLEFFLAHCTNLKELEFRELPNISRKSCLMAVNDLPQLQKFTIRDCALVTRSSEAMLRDAIARLESLSSSRTPPELTFSSFY